MAASSEARYAGQSLPPGPVMVSRIGGSALPSPKPAYAIPIAVARAVPA